MVMDMAMAIIPTTIHIPMNNQNPGFFRKYLDSTRLTLQALVNKRETVTGFPFYFYLPSSGI
jgi:hypothetical protein